MAWLLGFSDDPLDTQYITLEEKKQQKFSLCQDLNYVANKGGRSPTPPPPPQLSEKPFFQNVEIRLENCWGEGSI